MHGFESHDLPNRETDPDSVITSGTVCPMRSPMNRVSVPDVDRERGGSCDGVGVLVGGCWWVVVGGCWWVWVW